VLGGKLSAEAQEDRAGGGIEGAADPAPQEQPAHPVG
jgi:hypothetical protein